MSSPYSSTIASRNVSSMVSLFNDKSDGIATTNSRNTEPSSSLVAMVVIASAVGNAFSTTDKMSVDETSPAAV